MSTGNQRFLDRFGDLIPASDERVWFAAIRAADLSGGDRPTSDLEPLVLLLRAGTPLTQQARDLLADLLESHTLVREKP
jgi:hypothetical protein